MANYVGHKGFRNHAPLSGCLEQLQMGHFSNDPTNHYTEISTVVKHTLMFRFL